MNDKPQYILQLGAHDATGTAPRKQNFLGLKASSREAQNSAWRGSFNPLALLVATRKDTSGVLHNDKEMFMTSVLKTPLNSSLKCVADIGYVMLHAGRE